MLTALFKDALDNAKNVLDNTQGTEDDVKAAYKEAVHTAVPLFFKQLARSFIVTVFNRILILLLPRIFSWALFH